MKQGEAPDYVCEPNGNKRFLSRAEKRDFIMGGPCPKICPLRGNRGSCPNVDFVSDTTVARKMCEEAEGDGNGCVFIGNQVLDRNGPNYCVPKNTDPGCTQLTEADLVRSDKQLTDDPGVCDRLGKGCIFNRGTGDGTTGRSGDPTCLRGCLGSKFWRNPAYLWGGGGTKEDPFKGSFFSNDLALGPIYLEAAPSARRPAGWGGPKGAPFFGNGKLPRSLGVPYTESKGDYVPPCNVGAGDIGAFTTQATGADLAGPGCTLTPPQPRFGIQEWSYTCKCPFLGGSGEFKTDAWKPCETWELDQENVMKRDVCRGCYIQDDAQSRLYGHCVLGQKTPDTESKILGCVRLPGEPLDKCRVKRTVEPTECPAFCSNDPTDPTKWRRATQCAESLAKGQWELNPMYKKVISKATRDGNGQAPPYRPGPAFGSYEEERSKRKQETTDLCRNCAQTSLQGVGSGTAFPLRSYCVVGGNASSIALNDTGYGDSIARKLSCPPTCKQCLSGFFNEPLQPRYRLDQSINKDSAFAKGIIYTPWIGTQAVKNLRTRDANRTSRTLVV